MIQSQNRAILHKESSMKPLRILVALDRRLSFDRDAFVGIAQAAQGHDDIFLDLMKQGATLLQCVKTSNPRGIIVSTSTKAEIDEVVATRLPCVNVANFLSQHSRVPVVGNDDNGVGQMVAEHYLDRGFRHFAYLANPINSYFDGRRDAFCRVIRDAGLVCAIAPPLEFPEWETPVHEERIANWMAKLPKPLAVLCPYDNDARRATYACILAGLRIPEEVSIMGVDNDLTLCLTMSPQISSVATSGMQIGRTALKLLMSLIQGEPPPERPILIPPGEIVVRGSTGEMAIDDTDVAAAVHFIRTNLRKRLTVANVADTLSISRRTLERKFLHKLGRSPLEELRRSRVTRAKSLLINTDLGYVEVARLSGLIHIQRLSKLIKEDTGFTMRQFRAQFGRAK
jgi:LacI family transcriptional regulator